MVNNNFIGTLASHQKDLKILSRTKNTIGMREK